MKRALHISITSLLLSLPIISQAQSFNISSGINISRLASSEWESGSSTYASDFENYTYSREYGYNAHLGYSGYLGFEFRLKERLGLETGLRYLSRGYSYFENGEGTGDGYFEIEKRSERYTMNYFDLPITLNFAIIKKEYFSLYARAGVYAGLMKNVRSTYTRDYQSTNSNSSGKETYKDNEFEISERFTAGGQLGLGAQYKGFFAEANYMLGFINPYSYDFDIRSHDISFSLGYKFMLGGKE